MVQDREQVEEFLTECPTPDIAAYIDGELTPEAQLQLEYHLAACRVCSDRAKSAKTFSERSEWIAKRRVSRFR